MEIRNIKYISLLMFMTVMIISVGCEPNLAQTNHDNTEYSQATNQVKLISQIDWQKLNPARGDQSPQAGTIFGDRNGTAPTGFLAKFTDGFSSPPHIHNVTYRAVVIKGLIHNDDPEAEKMWMPAGSFWTQPAGEAHITAAKGSENIAYVEIDNGPYLVKSIDEAVDNGERPINIDKSNIVWIDATETSIIDVADDQPVSEGPKVAFLWENNGLTGRLIKLPTGFNGTIKSTGDIFHAVVVAGRPYYQVNDSSEPQVLDPGSYFTSKAKSIHNISSDSAEESIIYVRSNNRFTISQ